MKDYFQKYYPFVLSLIVLLVYALTLAPSVVEIDSGELATVQILAGIAHPTGYPLFTLVGYLFAKLPLFESKILQMNFLAAFWCALALIFFVKDLNLIFVYSRFSTETKSGENFPKASKKNPAFSLSSLEIILSVAFSVLLLAFSKTYWKQSLSVEVYSLQIFLLVVIIYFILRAVTFNEKHKWSKVAAALAFGFTNHMTTLLLLPGLAYFFFRKEGFNKESFAKLTKMIFLFFIILIIIYSYLPFRAAANPALNWGNPIDWEKFWRHFTGKQYQVWMFSSIADAKKQLVKYIVNLPSEFSYVGLILGIIGFYQLLKISKALFIFLLTNFLFTVFYVINYNIHDLDSYFLLSYITLSFVFPFAFQFLKKPFKDVRIVTGVFALTLIWEFIPNFNNVNQRNNFTFEDYAKIILNKAEKNSIILTYQWDYFVSASYYFRYVENYRRDVAVVDKELLRRSWYYNQLNRNYPFVLKGISPIVKNFKRALKPFERGEKYNSFLLEKYYRAIISGIISSNIKDRSVYLMPEMVDNELRRKEFALPVGYGLAPYYFCYKVVKGNKYVEMPMDIKLFRFPKNGNYYVNFVRRIVAEMLLKRAIYELRFNKKERAQYFVRTALKFYNGFKLPPALNALLTDN